MIPYTEFKNRSETSQPPMWGNNIFDKEINNIFKPDIKSELGKKYIPLYRCINKSQAALDFYARKAFESGKIPAQTRIYTIVKKVAWEKEGNKVSKNKTVNYFLYQMDGGKIVNKSLTKEEFNAEHNNNFPEIHIRSRNFPRHSESLDGDFVVKYFNDGIQKTAPYLSNLRDGEWRLIVLDILKKKSVDYAIEQMESKGFEVSIQPPYITVAGVGRHMSIVHNQAMSIRIPENHNIAENAKIDLHPSFESDLSIQNVVSAWRKTPNKHLRKEISIVELGDVKDRIMKELIFIASQNSLVKRYAFEVANLNKEDKEKLMAELKELGYPVTLDNLFIYNQFVGRKPAQYFRQYLIIDL